MGAFDDIDDEAAASRSPRLHAIAATSMFHRSDSRRRLLILLMLGGVLFLGFVALRKHDDIGGYIETQKGHWGAGGPAGAAAAIDGNSKGNSKWKDAAAAVKAKSAASKKGGKGAGAGGEKDDAQSTLVDDETEAADEENDAGETEADTTGTGKGFGKGLLLGGKKSQGKKKSAGKKVKGKEGEEKSIEELDDRLSSTSGGAAGESKEKLAPALSFAERKFHDKNLRDLRNETLGFGQIYVLNMKERTDKLDAMRVTSSLTGFNFEILEAPDGREIPTRALPGDFNEGSDKDNSGAVGCWRGHMDFANQIIKNRLSTALIMEDDADWDVNLKSQLEYVALGGQALMEQPSDKPSESPYGDGWDLMWLGHCGTKAVSGDHRRVVIRNDKTVTPMNHRVNFVDTMKTHPSYDNTTRLMFFTQGATCTYSYALSFKGAIKVLNFLSMRHYNSPVDWGLHDICADPVHNFKCVGIFPQLICDHKPAGGPDKDSDIGLNPKGEVRAKGFTYNIVHSARLNVMSLLEGKLDQATSQWPEDTPDVKGPVTMEWHSEKVDDNGD